MAQMIAGVYELMEKLGTGGGGIVYLANHVRLNKQVVLKEDKRKITASQELLRREVDVLKNLQHPYIPQVYDFFTEGDNVYTVMDYVKGESLDHPLKRGETFSQAQVIHWAIQLLQALCYLHSPIHGDPPHGFVHSDIKPANLMLRPEGDICLIDFNVALAIGEDAIGTSPGYASPEHYGLDFSTDTTRNHTSTTLLLPEDPSRTLLVDTNAPPSGTPTQRLISPDARSDLYSVGATLYHLLSGKRPAKSALDVDALSETRFSPQLVHIISKAMTPNVELRYQTAQAMLDDLKHLHENDPRTKRYRFYLKLTSAVVIGFFLLGGALTFTGLSQMQQAEEAARLVAQAAQKEEQDAKTALQLLGNSQQALSVGNTPVAAQYAQQALAFDTPYLAQAQKALTDALGVYDLADGLKDHVTTDLPSEALKLAVSPNGTRTAVLYAYNVVLIDTETGEQFTELATQPTATAGFCFLGEDTLLYAGEKGISVYDIAQEKIVWQGQPATRVACSADGKRVVGVNSTDSQAIVYDSATGAEVQRISFSGRKQTVPAGGGILADPQISLLALNHDGSRLAVSFEGGGVSLFDLGTKEEIKIVDNSIFPHCRGGFSGSYFVFSIWNTQQCRLGVTDWNGNFVGTSDSATPFLLDTDEKGIYLAQGNTLVQLDPTTGEKTELAYLPNDIAVFCRGSDGSTLAGDKNGHYALFNSYGKLVSEGDRDKGCELMAMAGPYVVLASRNTPTVQIRKMEQHPEAQVCSYNPDWKHIATGVSADGNTILLIHPNQLFLLSSKGGLLKQVAIPNPEQVYDQQYRRQDKNSWLEVTYEDGLQRAYSAKDGSVLWERQGEKPDESLEEEFETTRWRIRAPLHEAPTVYDKQTGEAVRQLEQDSYLTNVTETGDFLVTQYLSGQGEPYGLLLNQDCETLAYLPNLCDVIDQTLYFDDGIGNIRKCPIYSLPELQALVS